MVFGRISGAGRRGFLKGAGLAAMSAALGASIPFHRNMPAGLIPGALADERKGFVIEGNLIAFEMNGASLHPMNGAPLRLVIPGWPGPCSQKWLTRIWVRDRICRRKSAVTGPTSSRWSSSHSGIAFNTRPISCPTKRSNMLSWTVRPWRIAGSGGAACSLEISDLTRSRRSSPTENRDSIDWRLWTGTRLGAAWISALSRSVCASRRRRGRPPWHLRSRRASVRPPGAFW